MMQLWQKQEKKEGLCLLDTLNILLVIIQMALNQIEFNQIQKKDKFQSHSQLFSVSQQQMNGIKNAIKDLDFFSHNQFLRYRQQQNYRTLTGGIVSLIIAAIFIGLFANLAYDTINRNIIIDQVNISYDLDPSYYQLTPSVNNKFMFAVGITGLDLSSPLRYFDIIFQTISTTKFDKVVNSLTLAPCTKEQWSGISDSLSNQFQNQNFKAYLCPSAQFTLPLQGKYTSNIFKFGRILVNKCTTNLITNTTCANSSEVNSFINSNQAVTLNLYFTNPIINPGSKTYIQYYLQDRNYFTFNTVTGVNANIFFSEYSISTDTSILPWQENTIDQGISNNEVGLHHSFIVTNEQYAKINIRKSSERQQIIRSFQKVDQTLSYIGGLFGTLIIICMILPIYDKYCYEIEFGDRIFKQNNNGSYGSHYFNFIVFIGYGVYNFLNAFGMTIDWKIMREYHECRIQGIKQLDINLLFKKIQFFQQVSSLLLENYHLKGLHMIPKPTIKQIKQKRNSYMLQSIIFHQLQRKAREIHIEQFQYQDRYQQFIDKDKEKKYNGEDPSDLNELSSEIADNYAELQEKGRSGEIISQKIINKMGIKNIVNTIKSGLLIDLFQNQKDNQNELKIGRNSEQIISREQLCNPMKIKNQELFYRMQDKNNNSDE